MTLLHMNRLNKTVSAFPVSLMCFLLPEDLHSEIIRCEKIFNIKSESNFSCSTSKGSSTLICLKINFLSQTLES